MLRSECAHLKKVTANDIHEGNLGSLRCDVNRAAPDASSRAGISCSSDCMAYRPPAIKTTTKTESKSGLSAIRKALQSLIGK